MNLILENDSQPLSVVGPSLWHSGYRKEIAIRQTKQIKRNYSECNLAVANSGVKRRWYCKCRVRCRKCLIAPKPYVFQHLSCFPDIGILLRARNIALFWSSLRFMR
jgi:hypothetical protein